MTQLTTQSGRSVAPAAFGAMQFGGKASDQDAEAMFHAARAAGVAHFDTAWVYTNGASETLLGGLAAREREDLYIATKVGYEGGAGLENILAQFDTSRRRLQMDGVDLLYMHRFDSGTDLRETIETLAGLQTQGLIRHIGLSNHAAWQVMKAQAIAAAFGTRIDVIQPMFNLVKRQAEVELLPMCADQGITACCYSPLGGGLLTGKYARGQTGRLTDDPRYAARYDSDAMRAATTGLVALAEQHGTDPATLAVAWVAAHPLQPQPILSARSAAQLRPALGGLSFKMTPDLFAKLRALMPAPPPATDRTEEA